VEGRDLARSNAVGRMVLGAALVAAPEHATRAWIGAAASTSVAKLLARALGARDLALGAGLLWAQRRQEPEHPWITAAALADTVDAAATVGAWRSLPPVGRWLVFGLAAGSAAQMGALARATAR
jgi:hypothetical protein